MDFIVGFLSLLTVTHTVFGHGMLIDPIQRSSRWRIDSNAPENYDDNELFCGGFTVHEVQNEGKCGLCGDDYALPRPRPNELGGKYGQGVIVQEYLQGETITATGFIAASHKGYFYFELCNFDGHDVEEEECFERVMLPNGADRYYLPNHNKGEFPVTFELPTDLTCSHCILRWTYVTGNTWGHCDNGTATVGCGPQETFKTCSDISILPHADDDRTLREDEFHNLRKILRH